MSSHWAGSWNPAGTSVCVGVGEADGSAGVGVTEAVGSPVDGPGTGSGRHADRHTQSEAMAAATPTILNARP